MYRIYACPCGNIDIKDRVHLLFVIIFVIISRNFGGSNGTLTASPVSISNSSPSLGIPYLKQTMLWRPNNGGITLTYMKMGEIRILTTYVWFKTKSIASNNSLALDQMIY